MCGSRDTVAIQALVRAGDISIEFLTTPVSASWSSPPCLYGPLTPPKRGTYIAQAPVQLNDAVFPGRRQPRPGTADLADLRLMQHHASIMGTSIYSAISSISRATGLDFGSSGL